MVGGESGWETPAIFPRGRIPRLLDPCEWPWQWALKYVPFSLSRVQSGGLNTRGEEHLALLKLKEICSQQVGVGGL